MFRFIKRVIRYLIILFILLVIAVAGVATFVDPNNYKDQINEAAQEYSGLAIEIKGSIQWSFTPKVALYLQDVALNSLAQDKNKFEAPILMAKEAHIIIEPKGLLKRQIIVSGIELQGVTATLERTKDGVHNIDSLIKKFFSPDSEQKTTELSNPVIKHLQIKDISVKNSTFLLREADAEPVWKITDANLFAKDVYVNTVDNLAPIKINGKLRNNEKNIALPINTTLNIDLAKETINLDPMEISWYDLKMSGKALLKNYTSNMQIEGNLELNPVTSASTLEKLKTAFSSKQNKMPEKISGRFKYLYTDKSKILDISDIDLMLDDGSLQGKLNLRYGDVPLTRFNFVAEQFNLDFIFALLGTQQANAEGKLIPTEKLRSMNLEGTFNGKMLHFSQNMLINEFDAKITINNNKVQISPITIDLYEGKHETGLTIDLRDDLPKYQFREQTDDFNIEPFLKRFNQSQKISGKAKIRIILEAQGNDLIAIKQSLKGNTSIDVKSGEIHGIDVKRILQYTENSMNELLITIDSNKTPDVSKIMKPVEKGWQSLQGESPATPFDKLELRAAFNDGIAKDATVKLEHVDYFVQGKGEINFTNDSINLQTQAGLKTISSISEAAVKEYITKTPLSMKVTGSLQSPTYEPDLGKYLETMIKRVQKEFIKRTADKMIKKSASENDPQKTIEEIFIESLE